MLMMFCNILRMRMGRERVKGCHCNKQGTTKITYPYEELYGPKPRSMTGHTFTIDAISTSKWRWYPALQEALLSRLRELQ